MNKQNHLLSLCYIGFICKTPRKFYEIFSLRLFCPDTRASSSAHFDVTDYLWVKNVQKDNSFRRFLRYWGALQLYPILRSRYSKQFWCSSIRSFITIFYHGHPQITLHNTASILQWKIKMSVTTKLIANLHIQLIDYINYSIKWKLENITMKEN